MLLNVVANEYIAISDIILPSFIPTCTYVPPTSYGQEDHNAYVLGTIQLSNEIKFINCHLCFDLIF